MPSSLSPWLTGRRQFGLDHLHLGQPPPLVHLLPHRLLLDGLDVGVVAVLPDGGLDALHQLLQQFELLVLTPDRLQVVLPLRGELTLNVADLLLLGTQLATGWQLLETREQRPGARAQGHREMRNEKRAADGYFYNINKHHKLA